MKSKKIVASLAAMSVLAASSLSFAVTINGSNIKEIVNDVVGGKISVKGNSSIDKITAKKDVTLEADATAKTKLANTDVEVKGGTADLNGIKFKTVGKTPSATVSNKSTDQEITVLPAEK